MECIQKLGGGQTLPLIMLPNTKYSVTFLIFFITEEAGGWDLGGLKTHFCLWNAMTSYGNEALAPETRKVPFFAQIRGNLMSRLSNRDLLKECWTDHNSRNQSHPISWLHVIQAVLPKDHSVLVQVMQCCIEKGIKYCSTGWTNAFWTSYSFLKTALMTHSLFSNAHTIVCIWKQRPSVPLYQDVNGEHHGRFCLCTNEFWMIKWRMHKSYWFVGLPCNFSILYDI